MRKTERERERDRQRQRERGRERERKREEGNLLLAASLVCLDTHEHPIFFFQSAPFRAELKFNHFDPAKLHGAIKSSLK